MRNLLEGEAQGVEGFVAQAIKDMGEGATLSKGATATLKRETLCRPMRFQRSTKEIIENLKDIIFCVG